MKLLNIFLFLVMISCLEMWGGEKEKKELVPLSVHVPEELWNKIGSYMGPQKHKLLPEVIKFLNYDVASATVDKKLFQEYLQKYREPYLKEIGKKLAILNLKSSVFDTGAKPSFPE